MGVFTDVPGSPESQKVEEPKDDDIKSYQTDVEGVSAIDVVKYGKDEFPVFDCTEREFYQNMSQGRKRLRFNNGSAAQQYMSGTKYKRPFYIRTTTEKGNTYTRKIK